MNAQDFRSLQEAYMDNYMDEVNRWIGDSGDHNLRFNYHLDQNSVVLDFGGYHGLFTENIHNKFNCNVYVFEPYVSFYNTIVEKFKGNQKIKVFDYGVSNQTTETKLFCFKDGSSIINECGPSVDVKIKSFKDVYDELDLDYIDLIKINVEGSEFEILENIFKNNYTKKIKNFQIQFHKPPGTDEMLYNIRKELSKTHKQDWNYEWVWESWSLID